MRPVRLEASGFTCYRDPQEPLDFTGLSLFAIAGPTGAGKSSILDAILFALYGQVPRMGKQVIGEFIAHGRDAMAVTLDFAVRGTTYRVTRRVKRRGNPTVLLAELTPTGERPIAEQVRPVNEAILKLLGLDFSAFTQTVILPQNEFSKFLKADPSEQRGILQRLLRHDVFRRMREEAEKRKAALQGEWSSLERQLAGCAHASPEALAAKRVELDAARAGLAARTSEQEAQEALVQALRAQRRLTEDVQRLRAERAAIETREPAVALRREELAAARRAAAIVPRLDAEVSARERFARAQHDQRAAATALDDARALDTRAQADAVRADEASGRCEPLLQRIRAIDEIKGDLERRTAVSARVQTLSRQLPEARTKAAEAERLLASARTTQAGAVAALVEAKAAVEASGFDEREHARLDELWPAVLQVRAADDDIERLTMAHEAAGKALTAAEREVVACEKRVKEADRKARTAAAAATEAAAALDAARERNQAATLREHLHAGDACPVCLQTVVLLPPFEGQTEVRALVSARDAAAAEQAACASALQEAMQSRSAASASLQAAQRTQAAAEAALREKVDARAIGLGAVLASMAGVVPRADPAEALASIERRRAVLRGARVAHDRAVTALRGAETGLSAADLALVRAEGEAQLAADAARRLEEEQAALSSELSLLTARIGAVSTHEEPATERAALEDEVSRLRGAVQQAREALTAAQTAVAAAAARRDAAESALAEARVVAEQAETALKEAVSDAGFADVAAVKRAVRPAVAQAPLEQAVREHDESRAVVLQRLVELEPQVQDCEVSAEALVAAEAACTAAVEACRASGRAVARLEAECARLEADVVQRERLLAECERVRSALDTHAEMAQDLRGDAFQEYLLEEAFHQLVAGASTNMRRISNRYTLEWKEGHFYVVDHDNAGERRRAETLSGGETFMASLCLALQLSEEVLRTSGALQMDSLFIDEGFGTLDGDTLTEVTDAMEHLRADGSRLIGVISHRPELTERLPGCVRVTKGSGESRWHLERVG